MVSITGEWKRTTMLCKRRGLLPIGHRNISFRSKSKQLGILLDIQHAAGGGEGLENVQEGLESMRTGGEESHINSEPNGGNTDATHVESKGRGLGGDQFFCVYNLDLITRVNSTLFH